MGHDFNASIHRRMPLPRGCVVGGWYACGTVRQRCDDRGCLIVSLQF